MSDQPGPSATPAAATVAANIPFAELAGFLEKTRKKQGNENKKQVFRDFLGKWRFAHKAIHKGIKTVSVKKCISLISRFAESGLFVRTKFCFCDSQIDFHLISRLYPLNHVF